MYANYKHETFFYYQTSLIFNQILIYNFLFYLSLIYTYFLYKSNFLKNNFDTKFERTN